MFKIQVKKIFGFRDNCNKVNMSSMMGQSQKAKRLNEKLIFLAKDCKNIDEVELILKANQKSPKPDKQDGYFILVFMDDKKYVLSYDFCILTQANIQEAKFTPYIKYDIDAIRTNTLKPLECKLFYCKNKQEQIDAISGYIKKPHRRFRKWEKKPKKIFLYHSYNRMPIVFEIRYNEVEKIILKKDVR